MAIQAMDGQRSIDAVIPVHMGPPTTVISAQGTSAINLQVKNRKDVRSCPVDRSITIPDTSKPVISIIFELGCEQRGVRVIDRPHTTEEDPRQNDLHYEIVVYGYKSTELGVVPLEQEHMYRAILGGGSAVDDLPHRDDGMGSLEAFHNLKPAFYSHQQLKQFAGLIEGVEAPKGDPKKQPQRKTMEPTKEGPKTRRQSRALGVPTEEPKTRRQLGAPVVPGEEPKKKRAPEAEKSQPGPSKKRQKNK
ncbi:hypothetical protein FS749_013688 [Ceratobasidium sp. UAMH 11750]|nr:hypothetical protein FS749_013688 [Ceratobasidium sp. UAMH 11750]